MLFGLTYSKADCSTFRAYSLCVLYCIQCLYEWLFWSPILLCGFLLKLETMSLIRDYSICLWLQGHLRVVAVLCVYDCQSRVIVTHNQTSNNIQGINIQSCIHIDVRVCVCLCVRVCVCVSL